MYFSTAASLEGAAFASTVNMADEEKFLTDCYQLVMFHGHIRRHLVQKSKNNHGLAGTAELLRMHH